MKWLSISGFKYFLKASWSSYFDNLPSPFVSKALKIESITILSSLVNNWEAINAIVAYLNFCRASNFYKFYNPYLVSSRYFSSSVFYYFKVAPLIHSS
jgi:hypothetical protein